MELKPGSEIIFNYKNNDIYIVYGYNFDKSKICIFKKNFKSQNVHENLIYIDTNVIDEIIKELNKNNDSNDSNEWNNNKNSFFENIKNIINKIKSFMLEY